MKIVAWSKQNGVLLSLILIGFLLRIYKLDFQSIWLDEIFSMIHGDPKKSYGDIYSFIKQFDPHPPLYYFSLHFFFEIFGESTFIARFLSVLYSLGGMVAVYYLAKELFNRRTALISTGLVAINIFHITYSQEARMYTLLFFTTALSFYFLVRFIRLPSLKTALWYGFFAALMIYSHFYALFTLFAQYLIILYFVVLPYRIDARKFFLFSLSGGILTLILYIPAIFVFMETMKMSSIWIPMPEADNFTQMFKEFFGKAEIVVLLIVLGLIIFFIRLSGQKKIGYRIDPDKDKMAFALFVLMIWILISYFIPLISSYLNLPMLVSRYFISLLPAILILVAAGLDSIRNSVMRGMVLIMVVVFSLSNLFIEKDYYGKVTKTQWRELTTAIKKRNVGDDRVVMYWHWLMPYFFRDSPEIPLQSQSLDEYLASVRAGALPKESFWYMDGHIRTFAPSQVDSEFLNENYVLKDQIELLDCWARYYEPIGGSNQGNDISLASFKPSHLDAYGQLVLFNNAELKTKLISLEAGSYEVVVKGKSLPQTPIDGENAHIIISLNDQKIADFNVSEKEEGTEYRFPVEIRPNSKSRFTLVFDNDKLLGNRDRNLILSHFKLVRK